MDLDENSPLLITIHEMYEINKSKNKELSVFFAIVCIVDIFGVFPIIALPKAIIQCGWSGITLVIFIFSVQICTAILLGKSWVIAEYLDKNIVAKNRYPYAALAEMAFGKNISGIVTILLDVTIFGAGIPNIIVAAQNLQLFGLKVSEENFDFSFCYWMVILGVVLCPFLWLGSPKDMKILCLFSVTAVVTVSVMIWVCIFNDNSSQSSVIFNTDDDSLFENLVSTYGILAFQFDIHPVLLTIQVDMKDKSKVTCAIVYGFFVTSFLFALTTIFSALKYGERTHPNILEGLPPSLFLYVTVLLVTMQLCMTSAISNSALYQHIEDYLNIPREFNCKRCIIRSILTFLAVFVAETVPKFELVMSLIGGTLTGPLVFIFPPLFYMKLSAMKKQHISNISLQRANHLMYHNCESNLMSENICDENCVIGLDSILKNKSLSDSTSDWFILKLTAAGLVIIFGVLVTCVTTYVNVVDTAKYATFSPPCLYNFTFEKTT